MSDPWPNVWARPKACVESGATEREVTEYARELGRGLPDAADPVACARRADAVTHVVRDILGGAP